MEGYNLFVIFHLEGSNIFRCLEVKKKFWQLKKKFGGAQKIIFFLLRYFFYLFIFWPVSICPYVCMYVLNFFWRPLLGPLITWSDTGLSLVHQNSVSLMRTLKRSITCNFMMVSLMRTLKRSITCKEKCVPDGLQNSVSLMRTIP